MSVTYGFYNSKDGDRRYDAVQMSSIFDGIICDGVFQNIGSAMTVSSSEDMTIIVGTGRAWFNHTWTLNDSPFPLTVEDSEVILHRIDAVVIEVNSREEVRANSLKIIKGTPSSNPVKPSMIQTGNIWQYPLAYIRVNAGAESIRQVDITNCVGTEECPFVTAPIEKVSIDALLAQWEDEFNIWLHNLQEQLSGDVATNLQRQILELKERVDGVDEIVSEDVAQTMLNGTYIWQ